MNMGGINLIHQRESKDIKKAKAIEQEFAYSSYNSVMDSIEKGDFKDTKKQLEKFHIKYQMEGHVKLLSEQYFINASVANMKNSWNNIVSILSSGFDKSQDWDSLMMMTSFTKLA